MSNALAFGQYVPGKSLVHEINAQVKIILACVFSICVFFVSTWAGLLLCCLLVAGLYAAAELPLRKALGGVKPLAFLLAFTVLAQTFTWDVNAALDQAQALNEALGQVQVSAGSGALGQTVAGDAAGEADGAFSLNALWAGGLLGCLVLGTGASGAAVGSLGLPWGVVLVGSFGLTVDGFVRGVFFALRVALLLSACCLMSFTTSNMAIVSAMATLLKPLKRLHVPVEDLCLVISIALRFVPTVTQDAYAVKRAQEARGAVFEGEGFVIAIKSWAAVLTPLVVRLFKRADDLALAMEARCYNGARSAWHEERMSAGDVCVLLAGLAVILLVTVLL